MGSPLETANQESADSAHHAEWWALEWMYRSPWGWHQNWSY